MAGDTDAASIEQMNKVRVSLGLAPLPVPGKDSGPQFKSNDDASDSDESEDLSTLDKRQAAAGNNWQRLESERNERVNRQKRKDAAKKARDAAARFEKLQGKGLGDADDVDEVDTRTWLLQQKKRQKKIEKARKQEEELAAREQQIEYTSKDLAGVKVGHEAAQFDDVTGEQILTLKDAQIGDDSDDDELENADLRARERVEEKLKLKQKRPDYDPTELGDGQNILSKYDEEIDGKKQKKFTLDGQGSSVEAARKRLDEEGGMRSKGVKINLDILKDDVPASDYLDPSKIKIKKPKKSKKEKKSRQRVADDDDIFPVAPPPEVETNADAMDVEDTNTSRKRALDFDDDDLQSKLAEQRRQALKKRKKMDAAELARQMREEMPIDEEEPEEGLIIDETSEFVANLNKQEDEEDEDEKREQAQTRSPDIKDEDEDGDTNMESYAGIEDEEDLKQRVKRETSTPADMTATGLEDEESMSGGVAATIAMLRRRGVVDDFNEGDDRTAAERRRSQFLADKQHLIDNFDARAKEQREADRRSGRFDKMSNRDRDALARQQNDAREQYIAKLLADKYNKEYKPEVKLKYNDEYGREMNQKEAFKHLSHMFHGKGSGKQKTEKRLKKMEDEKKNEAKGMLNIGDEGGMMSVQGREGRRQKKAGVRLQ